MSDPTPPAFTYPQSEAAPVEMVVVRERPPQRYWLHALLLLLTIFTTLVVGTSLQSNYMQGLPIFSYANDTLPLFRIGWILQKPSRILLGLPFSFTLLTILLAHELGHYFYCLKYRVHATLPFFIPAPTLIGTMGAFIRIRAPIRSRQALFDIGIAGPIAGFVVALVAMIFFLPASKPGPASIVPGDIVVGYPLIFHAVHWLMLGDARGVLPLDHMLLHPCALAAWVGMFATALNLLPGGQLDGGHIIYSVAPRYHRYISRATIAILVPLSLFCWVGWLVWAILLALSGMRHPAVPAWPDISPRRKMLAVLALAMLILTVTPSPFAGNSLLQLIWHRG